MHLGTTWFENRVHILSSEEEKVNRGQSETFLTVPTSTLRMEGLRHHMQPHDPRYVERTDVRREPNVSVLC